MTKVRSDNATFILNPGESILEGLERTGHEVESHCRGGFCGACSVKLLEGEVEYHEPPLAFIQEGEILTCCSVPVTEIRLDCTLQPGFDIWNATAEDLISVVYEDNSVPAEVYEAPRKGPSFSG